MLRHPESERIFQIQLKQEIEAIEVPEFQIVWAGIKGFQHREHNKRQRKVLVQAAVVLLCITGAIAMFQPNFVTALSSKVEKVVLQRQDGTMEVRTKVAEEGVANIKTPPPPELTEPEPERFTVSFSEAQEITPFHLVYPQYLPEGYACTKVEIIKFNKLYDTHQFFQNGNNYFTIKQQNIIGEMASTRGFNSDVKISEVDILGYSATLAEFPRGNIKTVLFWETHNMQWELMGTIPAQELIQVAKSCK